MTRGKKAGRLEKEKHAYRKKNKRKKRERRQKNQKPGVVDIGQKTCFNLIEKVIQSNGKVVAKHE